MESQQSSSKSLLWILVILILIGIVTYFVINRANRKYQESPEANTYGEVTKISSAIDVKDQLADTSVIISNVALDKAGFVVITDEAGAKLGVKYFDRGERPGTVDLSSKTKINKQYTASLFDDTDGNKQFDPTIDQPLRNDQGQIISKTFTILESIPETKG